MTIGLLAIKKYLHPGVGQIEYFLSSLKNAVS
eukprot:CAMPEP_0114577816 /NCGR_PEP_ID=MMETSP0125-20121206/2429_1 /TAXON_ID=485358 ORGANISM="Aristerostoma sp., Strain ATCC 50986" /NCGR_SAMPLE_ID=MMETSP0125 /ASSEMBLY_ACC=CAM_ASM_000245 /LENGTH=31 /DNA_ID= /DNA_START= /DNA_END= /DNA_ORIENTATION=